MTNKMKILVTGAFGNVGMRTLKEIINQGYSVACFDIKNPANEQKAAEFKDQIDCFWGDLKDPATLKPAMKGCQVVVHLAAIIPPMSEKKPELTYQVNVKGTQTLIDVMKQMDPTPQLIFTSSITLFGDTLDLAPPRVITDPVRPIDTYSNTKAECEKLIHASGIDFVILRLAAAPAMNMNNIDPIMFEIRLDTRMEFVHPMDVARAITNAISCKEARGKTLLIGGGKQCQVLYRDFFNGIMEGLGIGAMPDFAFGKKPFYTDWLDTEESQHLLHFQQITYAAFVKEMVESLGPVVSAIKLLRPIVRLWLLNKSPYWKATVRAKFGFRRKSMQTKAPLASAAI